MNKFRWSMVGLIVAAAAISVIIKSIRTLKIMKQARDTAPVLENNGSGIRDN